MKTQTLWRIAAAGSLAVLVMATTGCELARQGAPPLTGPSSFALDVVLTASPDRIVQDGVSTTTVTATVRDASGGPVPNLALQWDVRASDGTFVEPSTRISPTDASGRTSVVITAPPAPAAVPVNPVVLTVTATPQADDTSNATPRQVTVQLITPLGTLPANNDPVPSFTISPAVTNIGQAVTFNAAATTDEGVPCLTRCSYMWDFGDLTVGFDSLVSHLYTLPGDYTVTLTVTDDRGGVASTSRVLKVSGPSAPVAQFTVTPASPAVNTPVAFSAATSSVGSPATIINYFWDFGDGTTFDSEGVSTTVKTYTTTGVKVVTLTVTDSLGRQASRSTPVTVVP
jgi:PKD repeat protein